MLTPYMFGSYHWRAHLVFSIWIIYILNEYNIYIGQGKFFRFFVCHFGKWYLLRNLFLYKFKILLSQALLKPFIYFFIFAV